MPSRTNKTSRKETESKSSSRTSGLRTEYTINTKLDHTGSTLTVTVIKLYTGATNALSDMINHHQQHQLRVRVIVTILSTLTMARSIQIATSTRISSLRASKTAVPSAMPCCNLTVQLAHQKLTLEHVGIHLQYKIPIVKQNVATASDPLPN
ncbi:hypothetical protein PoB_004893300 [Plakobranchus ocellatus]|uniref:Uncharacterized protein n=1 Tax=Plakobranchus ocellatus TaxID=259542 RepID=A0AAV4BT95_9GAST|nr:hypothetical protein PoB_004893300 [Plakobranchus ocellatus]